MKTFDKLEKIRIDNSLGINDFIDKSGISKTSYYALKDGKTESLSAKTIYKVVKAFPDYTFEWLNSNEDNLEPISTKPERQRATSDELFTLDVMRKHDELMKTTKIYQGFINGIISEEILKRINDNQHLKDLLGDK